MRSYSRQAVIVGLLITAIFLVLQWFEVFEPLRRQSIDLRSRYGWVRPRPMTPRICHVDIDDSSLRTIGRWPWPRSRVADAVLELRRAGAKTIAMDLIFSEPQQPEWLTVARQNLASFQIGRLDLVCPNDQPDDPCLVLIDHDAVLAAALHVDNPDQPGQCVLSVKPSEGLEYIEEWRTPRGMDEFTRLMDVLGGNIRTPEEQAANEAQLRGARHASFLQRPIHFREMAAWRELQRLQLDADAAGRTLQFQEFLDALVPDATETLGEFPERRLLEQAWEQHHSWRLLRRHVRVGGSSSTTEDEAPVQVLSREAVAVGFVNRQEDRDGVVRALRPVWPSPGGESVQLGLMAAANYLGLRPADISVEPDRLKVGTIALPLHEDRLWLAWPRPFDRGGDPYGVLRQSAAAPNAEGHVSLGTVVDLAQQRRHHDRNKRRFAALTYAFAMGRDDRIPAYDDLLPQWLTDARDLVEMGLQPPDPSVGIEPDEAIEDDGEGKRLLRLQQWLELEKAIAAGQSVLEEKEQFLRSKVNGKLVFIGSTFTGAAADFVPTPLGALTPGVVIHAVVADMVLSRTALRFAPPWSTYALILFMGLASTLAAASLTPVRSTLLALSLLIGYIALTTLVLFGMLNIVVALVAPVAASVTAWVGCTVMEATLFQRDRMRITRQFKARVSGQLVDYLVENPKAVALTGEQREMTIMFSDLAGFTSISESLGGPATVATLNRYMSAMTRLLIDEGAYLNKFLGDGFMAFWSAFAVDQHQATRACRAALHCQAAVVELNEDPLYRGIPQLSLRVGITTGRVVVGDCGAPPQLNDYTVIGDAVNLASRLESANKQFGTRILIDDRTRQLLNDSSVPLRPIGRVVAVGQTVPVDVFEVLTPDTAGAVIELTTRAVDAFRRGDLSVSAAAWRELAQRFGPCKLVDLYLHAIEQAGDDFDGVMRLHFK